MNMMGPVLENKKKFKKACLPCGLGVQLLQCGKPGFCADSAYEVFSTG